MCIKSSMIFLALSISIASCGPKIEREQEAVAGSPSVFKGNWEGSWVFRAPVTETVAGCDLIRESWASSNAFLYNIDANQEKLPGPVLDLDYVTIDKMTPDCKREQRSIYLGPQTASISTFGNQVTVEVLKMRWHGVLDSVPGSTGKISGRVDSIASSPLIEMNHRPDGEGEFKFICTAYCADDSR